MTDGATLTAMVTLAVAIVTGLGGILVAGVNLWGKLAEIAKDTAEARRQVKNSHSTNLREEIDAIRHTLAEMREDSGAEHDAIWQAITATPPGSGPALTPKGSA